MIPQRRKNFAKEKKTAFTVKEADTLFNFVFAKMSSMSKTAVKSLLSSRQIMVNDNFESKFDFPLKPGDRITVYCTSHKAKFTHSKVKIIHEDDHIIVIDKAAGLLSVATDKKEDLTAYKIIQGYVKKQNFQNQIFTVHRIDRETSGVLVFAKSKEVQELLQRDWQHKSHERIYDAIVEGYVEQDNGTITTWLTEDWKSKKVYSSDIENGGLKAVTHYEVIERNNGYSMLKVQLETGRKNQIRVQMQSIGHPIIGDKKYGSKINPLGRIGLHASVLGFYHPVTGKFARFESPIPKYFKLK